MGDLLFVAQVDADRIPLNVEDVDLVRVVRAAAQSAQPAAVRTGVHLVVEAPDTLPFHGDPRRLGQVCDNLLANALKFTPTGGTVTLILRRDGVDPAAAPEDTGPARAAPPSDAVVLEVTDTGIGIPAEELDHLFTRFFRGSTATARAIKGVGLGLHITRAIVLAHGGALGARSQVGIGTTFTVTLPIGGAEPAPDADATPVPRIPHESVATS